MIAIAAGIALTIAAGAVPEPAKHSLAGAPDWVLRGSAAFPDSPDKPLYGVGVVIDVGIGMNKSGASNARAGDWTAYGCALAQIAKQLAPQAQIGEVTFGAVKLRALRSESGEQLRQSLRLEYRDLVLTDSESSATTASTTAPSEDQSSSLTYTAYGTGALRVELLNHGIRMLDSWTARDGTLFVLLSSRRDGQRVASPEVNGPSVTDVQAEATASEVKVSAFIGARDAFAPNVFWRASDLAQFTAAPLKPGVGGRFTGSFPITGTPVEYYVEAWDRTGNGVTRVGPLAVPIPNAPAPAWTERRDGVYLVDGNPRIRARGVYSGRGHVKTISKTDESPAGSWRALLAAVQGLMEEENSLRTFLYAREHPGATIPETALSKSNPVVTKNAQFGRVEISERQEGHVSDDGQEHVLTDVTLHFLDLLLAEHHEMHNSHDFATVREERKVTLEHGETDLLALLAELRGAGVLIEDSFTKDDAVFLLSSKTTAPFPRNLIDEAMAEEQQTQEDYPTTPLRSIRQGNTAPKIEVLSAAVEHGKTTIGVRMEPLDAFAPTVFWRSSAKDAWKAEALRREDATFRAHIAAAPVEYYVEAWDRTVHLNARIGSPDEPRRAEPPPPRVAVLEFGNADGIQIDRTYFSDLTRGVIREVMPAATLMTRENMQVLLAQDGKALDECDSECEVDTGRKLSADLVVSGRLTRVGKRLKLTLRLYRTEDARLLGSSTVTAQSQESLDDKAPKAVRELMSHAQ